MYEVQYVRARREERTEKTVRTVYRCIHLRTIRTICISTWRFLPPSRWIDVITQTTARARPSLLHITHGCPLLAVDSVSSLPISWFNFNSLMCVSNMYMHGLAPDR